MEAEQTIEIERHAREVLVGVGDLALDSTLRIVSHFAHIAELKVDALLQEASSVTAPIPKQPRNWRRRNGIGPFAINITKPQVQPSPYPVACRIPPLSALRRPSTVNRKRWNIQNAARSRMYDQLAASFSSPSLIRRSLAFALRDAVPVESQPSKM